MSNRKKKVGVAQQILSANTIRTQLKLDLLR